MPGHFFIVMRARVAYAHDIVMAAVSFIMSLFLRVGDDLMWYETDQLVLATGVFTTVAAIVFWSMRMYRGVWRYASLNDLLTIVRAVSLVILVFFVFMFVLTRLEDLPRSLPIINWFILIALLGGPRFLYRALKDRRFEWQLQDEGEQRVPVLLAGADDGSELFIRATTGAGGAPYQAVGIVANRPERVGRDIRGVQVMGTLDDVQSVVEALDRRGEKPRRLVITKDDMDGARVRSLLETVDGLGMTLARIPRLTDLRSGVEDGFEVKPVAVEDLLGRPQATLDRDAMRAFVHDRRVLITGAGGSIGGELVRQVCDLQPAALVLVDNSEFNLYSIDGEVSEAHPALTRRAVIADVRERGLINRIVAQERPDVVFHAAALKHVPLVEANPVEGVRTNILGTVNLADACVQAAVPVVVVISTDKAVNPSSVMGATKRVAERYCQALDLDADVATRFVTVRFGNVLGSTGSVVPLFQKQLARGGPLTVTHPDMKRYFMTVREAVELVLQASAAGAVDADMAGKIFVLDMGDPVRIVDLARQMIKLAGLQPDVDIAIEITGPRPGEKLFEEVFHGGEALVPARQKGLLLAAPRAGDRSELKDAAEELSRACDDDDLTTIMARIRALVPEYQGGGEDTPRAAAG